MRPANKKLKVVHVFEPPTPPPAVLPPSATPDTPDGYTELSWADVCAEEAKFNPCFVDSLCVQQHMNVDELMSVWPDNNDINAVNAVNALHAIRLV